MTAMVAALVAAVASLPVVIALPPSPLQESAVFAASRGTSVLRVGTPEGAMGDDAPMKLQLFANATARNAICNDGSPSGYYLRRSASNSSGWVIYLEGGGLCYDYKTCKSRNPMLTGSATWPPTFSPPGLFANATSNRFRDFNQVFVIYCTSDLYSGSKAASGLLNFSFRGQHVVPALLEDLHDELSGASDVLFTGGSAGGIGVLVNWPLVRKALSGVPRLRAIPDAGWFLTTMKPYSPKSVPITKQLKDGMALWAGQPGVECAAAMGPKGAYQCYSGPVAYPFLPGPGDVMVLKAQTDAWTLGNDGVSLKPPYKAAELEWVVELAAEVRATFQLDKVASVFSANCIYHTALMSLWDTLSVGGTVLGEAVQQWFFDNITVAAVDGCQTPMCNPTCL